MNSNFRHLKTILFSLGLFFGGSLFWGKTMGHSLQSTHNDPKIIRLGNFEFQQVQFSYHVFRTKHFDSSKTEEGYMHYSFDTMPSTLVYENLICTKFLHNNQNDTHVVNQINMVTAPNFHIGQYEKEFSRDFDGLAEWMDSVSIESMANIESYLTPGPVVGNYVWLNYYYGEYWGGAAHPNSNQFYYIFNNSTGETVNYHHFFKATADNSVIKLISKEFKNQYKESPWAVSQADLLTSSLTFDKSGVTFFYSPYEIGPYAMGYVEILVPYNKLLKHLTSEGVETMNAAKKQPSSMR